MSAKEIAVNIKGSVGNLETIVSIPDASAVGIAFLSHPHPLFGGSMNNKIIYILDKAFTEKNWITIRHNFRGVGSSQGSFDNGAGEKEDFLKIISYYLDGDSPLKNSRAGLPICYAGFSFGTYVSCLAAFERKPTFLLLLGNAAGKWKFSLPPNIPTALIHGQNDEIIPLPVVLDWAAQYNQAIDVIPGADHFFSGKMALLKTVIQRNIDWMGNI